MSEARALLVTDVVDSTQLLERLGDEAAAALWTAHDRAARDLLHEWRGLEIDRTDGFLLLFDAAGDAVGYALAYHRAMAKLAVPLRARAGLHVGPVILRRNDAADVARGAKPLEVEGLAKPTAARVMSVALGGQTLLTAPARDALGPTTVRLQSHGYWRMKGVAEPVELIEAGDDGAPFTPPPDSAKVYRVVQKDDLWLPLREIRHSLPAERDAFVGRHEPLLELARRFETGARLVSVLGMGGSGKTRLATRFGWNWLGDYPGGVWFCDLSPARELDGIAGAVARGLDVPLEKGDAIARLGAAIAGRGRCLVILDNFEQVARHAEETVGRWLDTAAEARFLVTSREVLGLPGEQAYALAPLPGAEGAELFTRRAVAAKSDLALTAEDRAAIDPLVKLLDGLPLAIELAAARVRVMPPRSLLARMGERFRLLASAGGRRDRHATLRATLDWSWEMLSDGEKSALAQLSVFEDGFTREAAEAVVDLSACDDAPWVVDVLQSLVDKSLVRPLRRERFDMLGAVQAYAAEQLAVEGRFPGSSATAQQAAYERHCAWFAGLGPKRAVANACADLANLVMACRRSIATSEGHLAVDALRGAWAALSLRGPFSVGVELAEAVGAMADLGADAAAPAHAVHGLALDSMGRPVEARAEYEAALRLAQDLGDRETRVIALAGLAALDVNEGRMAEARRRRSEALELAREAGDAVGESAALNGLAFIDFLQGRLNQAQANFEMALARARDAGDLVWQCAVLGNLGNVYANIGRIDEARRCFEQALPLARQLGDRQREGHTLCNLGMLHLVRKQPDESIAASEDALRVARELGHARLEGIVQCNLGLAHEERGQPREALSHFDAALRAVRLLADRRSEGQFLGYLGRTKGRLSAFDEARECFVAGEALLRRASDSLSLAVLLCDRAECEWRAGDAGAAHRAHAEARAVAVESKAGSDSELGQALIRIDRLLKA
jgi:predicted ATPase/class 3 adenylate cyclase/Tfp pilus assembly protein PilF